MKIPVLLLFLILAITTRSQNIPVNDSVFTVTDTPHFIFRSKRILQPSPVYHPQRAYMVAAVNTAAVAGTGIWLYNSWYKQYKSTRFHFFDDLSEWLQVDKMGHSYTAYIISRYNTDLWRWAGMSRRKSIWMGGISGAAYQTFIEVFDGFSSGWGWSWGDFAANITGSGLFVGQEFAWGEQRISFKFSFHRKDYGSAFLNNRADDIFGRSLNQRALKDYNGQTYWLSANLHSFMPASRFPAWLNIALGYGAENMFGAREDSWKDAAGHPVTLPGNLDRYRQFYLAPDIDLTRIKTRSRLLRTTFNLLNCVKFPTPSIEFSRNKFRWNWMHF